MTEDVHILPPSILPCESVGGCDPRYVNHSHKSIINLF